MIFREPGTIVTRFAPSPTGLFHVGGIRSALYNYLFARKHSGIYILRCEDTDPIRSKPEYEQYFLDVFAWLGLEHDEYYRQSERISIYRSYLERLIADGKAYHSKETPKEEGQRDEVIRFRNPNTSITFTDMVLGEITFETKELGDFVIARDLDSPIYHFTVVVDDHEMGVTHVIRGQEHVSNTPRQILIQEAIGASRPIYAHASIIMNEARAKLSKRDPTVRPALEYKTEGYLPHAILNFMALLGWNPGTEQEIFTTKQLIESFTLERMQKPGAIFNPEKLEWLNKEHIKLLPSDTLRSLILSFLPESITKLEGFSFAVLDRALPFITERLGHFGELSLMGDSGDLEPYFAAPKEYDKEALLWKQLRTTPDGKQLTAEYINHIITILESAPPSPWTAQHIKELIWEYAEKEGRGNILWPMRYALSGQERSPDPFSYAYILGKDETLRRLRKAHEILCA